MDMHNKFNLEPPDITQLSLLINPEIGDPMFNMRDALSALPPEQPLLKPEGDTQVSKRKARDPAYSHSMPLTIELKAPTSPATLSKDDSLTYLNQDQPYIIKLIDGYGVENTRIRSIVRIGFYDERMQVTEAQHVALWQAGHVGERMLDVALDGCAGCETVYADPDHINALVCIWHLSSRCCISFKTHCVSTEFTARKHGGEKGVPFQIQVDSFREDDNSHVYSAACQVKVFKTKGADRKNRTDREKLEKRSPSERLLYRPSAPTTYLEEVSYCPMSRLAIDDSLQQQNFADQFLLAALDDFLAPSSSSSSSAFQQHTSVSSTPLRSTESSQPQTAPQPPSLMSQCKRSAQAGDDSLGSEFSEISLAAAAPIHPPPTKNGRLFSVGTSVHSLGPSASTEANVDELPFSQCEISEQSPVTGQTPSTPASTDATVFSFPKLLKSAPAKSLTRECATLDVVFKQPRALPASQKRSTSLRASDEERGSSVGGKIVAPCAGCCSKCGRACCTIGEQAWRGGGSFSVEWSAKRQRRRKHLSSHQKHHSVIRLSSTALAHTHHSPSASSFPLSTAHPPSDYFSQTVNDDSSTQPRRPSTSSETSQQIPSDKSSLLPSTSQTKSDVEEDFPEEEVEEREPPEDEEEEEDDADDESGADATNSLISATPRRSAGPDVSGPSRKAVYGTSSSNGTRRVARTFRADMSRAAVANWLRASGFGSLRSKFAKFTGADILRLNRRDLILLCGTVEGIRLSNAILLKPPRATCTIYVRQDTESIFQAIYLYQQTEAELRIRLSSSLKLNSPQQISLVLKNAQNIDVAVTDDVVAYFEDQNCFTINLSDPATADTLTIYMKKM